MITPQEKNKRHDILSWRSWAGIFVVNIGGWLVMGLILRVFNLYNPFVKALLPVLGLFIFSIIIVSNVQNKKPWILWNSRSKS